VTFIIPLLAAPCSIARYGNLLLPLCQNKFRRLYPKQVKALRTTYVALLFLSAYPKHYVWYMSLLR
jgi:hypothetical protein